MVSEFYWYSLNGIQILVVLCIKLITFSIILRVTVKKTITLIALLFYVNFVFIMIIPANNVNALLLSSLSTASTASPHFIVAECYSAGSVLFISQHFVTLKRKYCTGLATCTCFADSHIVDTLRWLSLLWSKVTWIFDLTMKHNSVQYFGETGGNLHDSYLEEKCLYSPRQASCKMYYLSLVCNNDWKFIFHLIWCCKCWCVNVKPLYLRIHKSASFPIRPWKVPGSRQ